MSRKITIIGAGSVGSTIAYSLSQEELASEIGVDLNSDESSSTEYFDKSSSKESDVTEDETSTDETSPDVDSEDESSTEN